MNTTAKRAVTACIATLAVSAVAASAATAVPATFNMGGGPMQLGSTTSLVVKAGTTPTATTTFTCGPVAQSSGSVFVLNNLGGYGYLSAFNVTAGCVNGLGQPAGLRISNNTSQALRGENNGGTYSLTGIQGMSVQITRPSGGPIVGGGGPITPYSVPWTNGTPSIPSTAAFTDEAFSMVAVPAALTGQPITLTGTISIDPGFGTPLLLN